LVSTGEISADRTFDHKCFLIQTGNPDPETILYKSEQLLANNRKIMALLLLEKALDMYPNHLDLIYQKAVTLTKIGQTNSAVASLKSVLDIAPDHKQANLLISKLSH
nr:tetratricopeptide repeat protein [Bacteroidota bacterium]